MAKSKTPAFLKDPTWYKDAVIYQAHVKCYFDANNDGVGDFAGLIAKLDYIAELGVNAIWLLPFYPSPMRDDGYDIAEYRAIHPAYGTLADAKKFIAEAHRRGLRVITELVINHTSDQHPWFQKARRAKKDSRARNFYVWSDTNQKYEGTRIIFSDTENSNWTWDPVAGQYFWHRFYSNQPDLNFDNPEVLEEVLSVMRYWFDIGVDGLRLDAIPYLVEREGTSNENLPETHAILKQIRAYLDKHYPDRMLLAEANLWPEDIQQYFGNGDECHMAFHFPLMPRMYMAIAQEDRFPIMDILRQMPEIPANCQWAIFLRNHDELTLEMVTDQERDYLWNHYAADKRARINLGIRRRLAPLVERDRRRIELLNSLLLSMPGTPTLYYGDEIGMGDNIFLGDRHGVRTPMQWSDDRNGGFSRADPASLIAPAIMDPLYGFQSINVESQARDTHSLLNWMRRMLAIRKQQKAFGRGNLKLLSPANRRIFAYVREYTGVEGESEIILCVANVSRAAQAGELDLSAYVGKIPVEMVGGTSFPPITKLNYLLTLPPYGFYWFYLADESQMPSWYVAPAERMPELRTVIIRQELTEIAQLPVVSVLEQESLPAYLPKCPWFTQPGEPVDEVRLSYVLNFGEAADLLAFAEVEVVRAGNRENYFLPLGFVADHLANSPSQQLALARLRKKRTAGLLTDAYTLPDFSRAVIKHIRRQTTQSISHIEGGGELQFIATLELPERTEKSGDDVELVSSIDTNGSVVIGESLVLKPIRKLMMGVHPDIEINEYLYNRGFAHVAPPLGEVRRTDSAGNYCTLMILQGFISNQGDAWQWTQNTLERALRDRLSSGTSAMDIQYPATEELNSFAKMLGQRLAEMHELLAADTRSTRFGVTETSKADIAVLLDNLLTDWQAAMEIIVQQCKTPDLIDWFKGNNKSMQVMLKQLAQKMQGGLRMRIHGRLSLLQVLVVRGDAWFVNFDGETTELSQLYQSPLKDVADLLCSFDDAAALAIRNAPAADTPVVPEELQMLAGSFSQKARTAFYDSYRKHQSLPHKWRDNDGESAAIRFLCLSYRVRELMRARYRPDLLEMGVHSLSEMSRLLLESEK